MLHHAFEAGLTEKAAEHAEPTARTALHRGDTRQALTTAQAGIGAGSTWRLQATAARAAGWLGAFEVAAEHAERWADEAATENDRAQLVYASCHLAWCRSWAEDTHGAAAALHAATTVATDLGDNSAAAHALATRARFEMVWNRPTGAAEAAAEATAMAERVGDRRTLASAKLYLAGGILDSPEYQSEEELARAARFLDEARAEAEALGDAETLAAAIHNRLVPEQPDDVPPQASLQLVQEGYRVADRYGNERLRHKLDLLHLYFHVVGGNRAAAEEALIRARHAPLHTEEAVWREALEVELALASGAVDVAKRVYTDHRRPGDDHGPAELIDIANAGVQLAAHQQDPARAEQGLRQVGAELDEVCPCVAVTWWETAIHALQAGTDPDLITQLLAAEAPTPLPRHAGLSNHTRGALAIAKGDGDSAIEALGIAVTEQRRGRRASLLADVHLQLAGLAMGQGRHDQAAGDLARARSWLEHWPGPLRDRIERLQAEARADPDDGGNTLLTRRELEVVRLVARGHTNGQIADRLFVTTKTVSTHVSNALSKTGFQRRTQLGTWAVREGLADDGGASRGTVRSWCRLGQRGGARLAILGDQQEARGGRHPRSRHTGVPRCRLAIRVRSSG